MNSTGREWGLQFRGGAQRAIRLLESTAADDDGADAAPGKLRENLAPRAQSGYGRYWCAHRR